jgi:hypothetical protein
MIQNNKIGSILLLLSCIFVSLGFGLIFQNKTVLESFGFMQNMETLKQRPTPTPIESLQNFFITKISDEVITRTISDLKNGMNKIKSDPNYKEKIIECINFILNLDKNNTSNKLKLVYMKNFIILPNEFIYKSLDKAPKIIQDLDKILETTDNRNWQKIQKITKLVNK